MIKRFLFALAAVAVLFAGAPASSAPTGWGQTATMGWTKYAMVAVNVGHRIYLIGDRDTLHIYDITKNTWSTGNAPPLNQYGPAVALGGKIYLLGGVTGPKVTGNCAVYDPTADSWTSIASLPSPRGAGAAAVLNGKIHLIGGRAYQGATLVDINDQQIYDPVANAWHTGSAMPTARDGLSLVADPSSGKLYAIGGWNSQSMNPSTANEIYSPTTHAWTKGAPLPTGRFSAGAALLKGKIYVLGEHQPRHVLGGRSVQCFDRYVVAARVAAGGPAPGKRRRRQRSAVRDRRQRVPGLSVLRHRSFLDTDALGLRRFVARGAQTLKRLGPAELFAHVARDEPAAPDHALQL